MRPRLQSEQGQVAIEFTGTLWMILLAGVIAWQLALIGWTAVGAANAARTAARAYGKTQDVAQASDDGESSLSGDGLGAGSRIDFVGGEAVVHVYVPLIVPGLKSPFGMTETAAMPVTG